MAINAGDKARRYRVQRDQAGGRKPSGQSDPNWITFFECWGWPKNNGGREFESGNQVQQENTDSLEFRWCPELEDLSSKDRLIDDKRKIVEIVSVENVDQGNEILLLQVKYTGRVE